MTMITYETPNLANLERLIQSKALPKAIIQSLKSYVEKIDHKTFSVKVEYNLDGFGRFKASAKGGNKYTTTTTASGMKREVRNLLFGENYDDLDIVNASGQIMCQLFQKNGLKTEYMTYLNANREHVLKEIMNFHDHKVERATAKDILIEIFFCGGGHSSQYWELNPFTNKRETIIQYALPPFVEELKKEYNKNLTAILSLPQFKMLKDDVIKKKKEKCEKKEEEYTEPWIGQYGAILYQDEERKVLEVLVKTILRLEKERNMKNVLGALIFDGLHAKKEFEIINYVHQLESAIHAETGYKLKLEIKSMDVDDETRNYYIGDKEAELSYEAHRAEFEKTRFKTKVGKFPFHTIRGNDILSRDKGAFSVANEDWIEGGADFLRQWYGDPSKRSYEEIEYACVKEEDRKDDIFYSFPTLRYKTLSSTSTEEEQQSNIRFFQEYISLLVEGKPIFTNEQTNEEQIEKEKWSKWMTFWIADILLNPDNKGKQPIACIFFASQGSGKTSLRVLMERLLGKKCVHHTEDPTKNGDILHEFNSTLKYKLFLEFEEINMRTHTESVGAIKQLITNHTHTITHKGQDSVDVKASERTIFTTNISNSACIEKGDRRYVAFAMSNAKSGNTKYWDIFYAKLDDPNFIKDIADYLCSFKEDVNRYAFRDERPFSSYYNTLIQLSMPSELDFLKDNLFYNCDSLSDYKDENKNILVIPSSTLCDLYNEWRKAHALETKVTSKSFTAKIESLAGEYGVSHKKTSSSNVFVIDITKAKTMLKKDFLIAEDEPQIARILTKPVANGTIFR